MWCCISMDQVSLVVKCEAGHVAVLQRWAVIIRAFLYSPWCNSSLLLFWQQQQQQHWCVCNLTSCFSFGSVMKDPVPGRWWLAGLERKGWRVLDLTLDGDPTSSSISCNNNINMCSSLVSLSANVAMASAVRDFSALLLSNSSTSIYNI